MKRGAYQQRPGNLIARLLQQEYTYTFCQFLLPNGGLVYSENVKNFPRSILTQLVFSHCTLRMHDMCASSDTCVYKKIDSNSIDTFAVMFPQFRNR